MTTKQHGFTLIELLITLAIVGILTSIAYPAYRHHITKVRRSQATVMLTTIATELEHYYNHNHSYEDAEELVSKNSEQFYQFELTATETSYIIKAIPLGAQATADHKCGILTLDQLGNKTSSNETFKCW